MVRHERSPPTSPCDHLLIRGQGQPGRRWPGHRWENDRTPPQAAVPQTDDVPFGATQSWRRVVVLTRRSVRRRTPPIAESGGYFRGAAFALARVACARPCGKLTLPSGY